MSIKSATRFWAAYPHSRKPFEVTKINGGHYDAEGYDTEGAGFADEYDWSGRYLNGAFTSEHYEEVVGWIEGAKFIKGIVLAQWRKP